MVASIQDSTAMMNKKKELSSFWDQHWTKVLNDYRKIESESLPGGDSLGLLSMNLMRACNLKRVLFAGNGISLEPYCFAHCGFEVVALDISGVASEFVRTTSLSPDRLASYFPGYVYEKRWGIEVRHKDQHLCRESAEQAYRPGGSVTVVAEDLLSHAPALAYDVVYSNNVVHNHSLDVQSILARNFYHWLRPGGIALIEVRNVPNQEQILELFRNVGFFEYLKSSSDWFVTEARKRPANIKDVMEQFQELSLQEGVVDLARLRAGEKMVWFRFGSG